MAAQSWEPLAYVTNTAALWTKNYNKKKGLLLFPCH